MPQSTVYCGIDVAKDNFDFRVLTQAGTLPNTPAGFRSLFELLQKLAGSVQVICESTGPYHLALVRALQKKGIAVSIINARWVRDFARSRGILEKTDRMDARSMVLYAESAQPSPSPVAPAHQIELCALVSQRDHLVRSAAQEKTRLHQLSLSWLRTQSERLLRFFETEIRKVEAKIKKVVAADPELSKRVSRIDEAAGFTAIGAARLCAVLPELGTLSRRKIAKLAGLAPIPVDSGLFKGTRRIQGGRACVRRMLYMAAITAIKHNPTLQSFYNQLIARHKPFKVAITAVMRKLLTLLNAALKNPQISLAS